MNTYTTDRTPHLDDAELMQLLDRVAAPDEHARWDAHVAACAQCAGEVDRLRADARVVRTWLERAAFEDALPLRTTRSSDTVPHGSVVSDVGDVMRRRRTATPRPIAPWLRVAAAIALVALPVAAITTIGPLRDWLGGGAEEAREDAAVRSAPATSLQTGTMQFVPVGSSFVVRLDAAQNIGTLSIAQVAGESATLELSAAGVVPVFAETELHLRNAPTSTSSYSLRLPATVTRVTVRIGARTLAVFDAAALRAGSEVLLR